MKSKLYFPNLNGLRFIAALLVIIHHIEQFKTTFGLPGYWHNPFISVIGHQGVILFFVLSGFLITYLLLKEKEETKTVSIRSFYIRRILKIWPLYYLVVLLGLFVLPSFDIFYVPGGTEYISDHLGIKTLLFFFFLPNMVGTVYIPIPLAGQTWSIGVEEQFYLIWPVLVKKFKSVLLMLGLVFVVYIIARFFLLHFHIKHPGNFTLMILSEFWSTFAIDCMVIGGLGAYVLFHKKTRILSFLFNPFTQCLAYGLTIFLLVTGQKIYFFNDELYGILFCVLIVNLSGNPKSLVNLEYKPLLYLGKISYGLYMYHSLCIVAVIKLAIFAGLTNNFFIYPAVLLLTVLVSALSYRFFEYRFIKSKARHSKIISGEEARDNGDTLPAA